MGTYDPVYPPDDASWREQEALNNTAQTIGATAGRAANVVRNFPARLQDFKHRLKLIPGQARQRSLYTAYEIREKAERQAQALTGRTRRIAHTYPLQVIAAAAGLGLALGIALRLWRDSRE